MGLYEYPGEATLLTFARLPPAEGETVQEILKQSTVLKYRKVGLLGILILEIWDAYLVVSFANVMWSYIFRIVILSN